MVKRLVAGLLCVLMLGALFACGQKETEEVTYSEGLTYTRLPGGECSVSGIGSCTDTTLRIPATSPDGDSVTQIAGYAFQEQSTLTAITLPSTVKKIGAYAFAGCSGITSMTLPDGIEEIGLYAFSRCTGLTQIYLGSSLTKIEDGAFHACVKLQYAFWRGNAAAWSRVEVGSGNAALTMGGTLYYYSATTPRESGYFWYYQDGSIRIWS
jgi:hypothetical protein